MKKTRHRRTGIIFPIRMRIDTPTTSTFVSPKFQLADRMVKTKHGMAVAATNEDPITLGPVKEGDNVVLSLFAPSVDTEPVAWVELKAPSTGDVVLSPGMLTIAVPYPFYNCC